MELLALTYLRTRIREKAKHQSCRSLLIVHLPIFASRTGSAALVSQPRFTLRLTPNELPHEILHEMDIRVRSFCLSFQRRLWS